MSTPSNPPQYSPGQNDNYYQRAIAENTYALASGGGSAPGAPTQVATASGANLSQAQASVTSASSTVAAANATARVLSFTSPTSATGNVTLSYVTPAVFGQGFYTLFPGGLYETPVPVTKAVYAISDGNTVPITVVQFL